MDGPSTDGLLDARGAVEAEGDGAGEEATPRRTLTGGQTSRLGIGDSDDEDKESTARRILSSSERPPNFRMQILTPQFGHGTTEAGGAMDVEGDGEGEEDVLAIPVSTIASEASFSTGGRVISPQRSSLSAKMVEALICAQSWLRSSPNKIDIRQTIEDLHKYEELAQELGALECGET